MTVNPLFDQLTNIFEQDLWEDLIIESIQIFGEDMFYIPRELQNFDSITGTDPISKYTHAIPLELYITSVSGFSGQGPFLSSFGLQIQDQVTFTVAKKRFEEEITPQTQQSRPNEGDVIYFPLNDKVFVIDSVDYKPFFYQHGALQIYDLNCRLFQYSNEEFSTGIPRIDRIQTSASLNILDHVIRLEDGGVLLTENGDYLTLENTEPENIDRGGADNTSLQKEADSVIDNTEISPFTR